MEGFQKNIFVVDVDDIGGGLLCVKGQRPQAKVVDIYHLARSKMPKRSDVIYGDPQYRSISNLLMHLMLSVVYMIHLFTLTSFPISLCILHNSYFTSIKPHSAYCEGPDRTVKTWKEGDNFTLVSRWSTKLVLIPFTKVTRGQRLGQLLLY